MQWLFPVIPFITKWHIYEKTGCEWEELKNLFHYLQFTSATCLLNYSDFFRNTLVINYLVILTSFNGFILMTWSSKVIYPWLDRNPDLQHKQTNRKPTGDLSFYINKDDHFKDLFNKVQVAWMDERCFKELTHFR